MLAGKGDLLPVSAFPVDGTWPVGTAKWEKRNLALEIPVWDAKVCIQCNQCALVCPHAAIRAKVYDEGALSGPPRDLQVDGLPRHRVQGQALHDPGGARGLHGLQPLRERVPGQGPHEPQAQSHQHGAPGPAARHRAGQLRLLPRPARAPADRGRAPRPQGLAVPGAALRVLRGLRGLRRDALPQAAHPALRRPPAHRQRHRLLVDLRRQPAHDPLHHQPRRAGPSLVELALRGQRGVRIRLPPGPRRPPGRGAGPGRTARSEHRRRPRLGDPATPTRRASAGSRTSARGSGPCARSSSRSTLPRRSASCPWPTTW